MRTLTSLIGAALLTLVGCSEPEKIHYDKPSEVVLELLKAGAKIEEGSRESCYTFGEEIVRRHKIPKFTITVGERSLSFTGGKKDLYKTLVGDVSFISPRLEVFDIRGDWLDQNWFLRAMCPEDMACYEVIRMYDSKDNEYTSDRVFYFQDEKPEIDHTVFFSRQGLEMVNQMYAQELGLMLEEALETKELSEEKKNILELLE